jgi:hypothetical protein
MRCSTAAFGAALAFLTVVSPSARADLIPWAYSWSNSPDVVHANSPGTGYITLTDESLKDAVGDSDIVATNLHVFSTAPDTNPDRFTAKAYTLTLQLVDTSSGASGTFVFTGQFDGTLTATSANIKNTFTGTLTQSLVLGGNLYTVTMGSYTSPGPPGESNSGSISAHALVSVQPAAFVLPEPSGFLLAGTAVPCVGLLLWRRGPRRWTPLAAR